MKYLVLVGDGMGDYPQESLSGKTPLQTAHTPHMDFLAKNGRMGLARTIPEGKEAGSDVANLNILGYDPVVYHTGRAPLETANMGIKLHKDDIAFRCNLVTLSFGSGESIIMEDYSAGHIATEKATPIIRTLEGRLGREGLHFFPGVSYRHAMVWKNGRENLPSIPPHDMLGQEVGHYLREDTFFELNQLIRESWNIFKEIGV